MVRLKNTGLDPETEAAAADMNAQLQATTALTPVAPQSNEVEPENGDAEENGETNGKPDSNVEAQRKRYLSLVAGIGREYGTGKKALVNLATTIVEGSMLQVIKPGAAESFYKRFRDHADKKATTAGGAVLGAGGNENSIKSQVSKLRAFIKFGNEWRDDASDIVNRAIEVHAGLLVTDPKTLKLSSTYSALVAVARKHMDEARKGVPMTDQELQDMFLGAEPKVKVAADYIEAAIKAARQAQKGKEPTDADPTGGREAVEHESLDAAISELRQVLADIDPDRYQALIKAEEKAEEKAQEKREAAEAAAAATAAE